MRALDLQLRPATPADDAFLRALGRPSFSRWSRDPAESVVRMSRATAAATLVAERAGEGSPKAVGFAIVRVEPLGRPFGPWAAPAVAHLDAVAVSRAARGAGVGTALLRAAEELAAERGAVVLSLVTAVANVRARKLFEGAGYLPTARLEAYYLGEWDAIAMFRPLA